MPPVEGDVVETLRAHRDAACVHTRIASSGWMGERFDVHYAIDVLHPLAVTTTQASALQTRAPIEQAIQLVG